jgi:hypothetical protein
VAGHDPSAGVSGRARLPYDDSARNSALPQIRTSAARAAAAVPGRSNRNWFLWMYFVQLRIAGEDAAAERAGVGGGVSQCHAQSVLRTARGSFRRGMSGGRMVIRAERVSRRWAVRETTFIVEAFERSACSPERRGDVCALP